MDAHLNWITQEEHYEWQLWGSCKDPQLRGKNVMTHLGFFYGGVEKTKPKDPQCVTKLGRQKTCRQLTSPGKYCV